MEATIASDDSVELLGHRGAFVRVAVVERKGPIERPIGVVVFGDLVTFRLDDGAEEQHLVRRMEVSLFHDVPALAIADLPAELVPFVRSGTGGDICVAVRAFRCGERVRIENGRIEELA